MWRRRYVVTKRERGVRSRKDQKQKITYMNNENWTVYQTNSVNILELTKKIPSVNLHDSWRYIPCAVIYIFLPCKCQTNMSVLQGTTLSNQIKLGYVKQRLSSLEDVMQDRWWDHYQQTDHIVSVVRLSPHTPPWGIYVQHQCLRMYYIQSAVSKKKGWLHHMMTGPNDLKT